jgi:hypothetical protein
VLDVSNQRDIQILVDGLSVILIAIVLELCGIGVTWATTVGIGLGIAACSGGRVLLARRRARR